MPVIPSNGHHITLDDILPNLILEPDVHFCPTRLICLENTCQGLVFPQEEIVRISEFAREKDIAMHVRHFRLPLRYALTSTPVRWCATLGSPGKDRPVAQRAL